MYCFCLNSNKKCLFILILSFFSFSVLGERFGITLQYDRTSIINGELWRVVTCHLIHTGWNHLFLNLAGTLLLFSIFGRLYPIFLWFIGLFSIMLGISFSFLLFYPELEWYIGLSGVLHGSFAMGIMGEIKRGNKIYYIVLLTLLGKVISEQVVGPSSYTTQLINAPIITSAHFYGTITGGVISLLLFKGNKGCQSKFDYLLTPITSRQKLQVAGANKNNISEGQM